MAMNWRSSSFTGRAPRTAESAFGSRFSEAPRPTRGRQMLRALLLSVGTVALTLLAIYLMARPQ